MLSHLLNILQYWRCSKQLIRFNLVTTQEGVGHNVGAVPCACPDSSFTPTSKGRHKALPFGGYLNSYLRFLNCLLQSSLLSRHPDFRIVAYLLEELFSLLYHVVPLIFQQKINDLKLFLE